jgi:hypothetical protein
VSGAQPVGCLALRFIHYLASSALYINGIETEHVTITTNDTQLVRSAATGWNPRPDGAGHDPDQPIPMLAFSGEDPDAFAAAYAHYHGKDGVDIAHTPGFLQPRMILCGRDVSGLYLHPGFLSPRVYQCTPCCRLLITSLRRARAYVLTAAPRSSPPYSPFSRVYGRSTYQRVLLALQEPPASHPTPQADVTENWSDVACTLELVKALHPKL